MHCAEFLTVTCLLLMTIALKVRSEKVIHNSMIPKNAPNASLNLTSKLKDNHNSLVSSQPVMLKGLLSWDWVNKKGDKINFANLPGDFLIAAMTDSTTAIVPLTSLSQIQRVLYAGKGLVALHTTSHENPVEIEARFFLNQTRRYRGLAIPMLDYNDECTETWAKTWLAIVAQEWGVKPWLALTAEKESCGNWLEIARNGHRLVLWEFKANGANFAVPQIGVSKYSGPKLSYWSAPVAKIYAFGPLVANETDFLHVEFYGDRKVWDKYVRLPPANLKSANNNVMMRQPVNYKPNRALKTSDENDSKITVT